MKLAKKDRKLLGRLAVSVDLEKREDGLGFMHVYKVVAAVDVDSKDALDVLDRMDVKKRILAIFGRSEETERRRTMATKRQTLVPARQPTKRKHFQAVKVGRKTHSEADVRKYLNKALAKLAARKAAKQTEKGKNHDGQNESQ